MRNRLLFRENGTAVRTRQIDWGLGVLAAVVLITLLALTTRADERDEALATAEARAYANGAEHARTELLPKVAAAYEQGLREGHRSQAGRGAERVKYCGVRP